LEELLVAESTAAVLLLHERRLELVVVGVLTDELAAALVGVQPVGGPGLGLVTDPEGTEPIERHRVVLCSSLTLFSVLAIIRRAIENFQLERRSSEILRCLVAFQEEWGTFTKHLDKTSSQFKAFKKSWDELIGIRRDELQDPVDRIRAYGFDEPEPLAGGASQPDAATDLPVDALDHAARRAASQRAMRPSSGSASGCSN